MLEELSKFSSWSLIFQKALALFLIIDPLGSMSIINKTIAPYEKAQQKKILKRELFISIVVIVVFFFTGSGFLKIIGVSTYTIEFSGSIFFFLFALHLLFPFASPIPTQPHTAEPFIVPIAIPLIAGPSVLAVAVLYSHNHHHILISLLAIFFAWSTAALILWISPSIVKKFGKTGLAVCEQIMGLMLAMIAIKMFLQAVSNFSHTL